MAPLFERVTIVGVGLIGGSLGLALKGRGLAGRVVGVGHAQTSLNRALERGAIDESTLDVAAGVGGADLVVLATPVGHIVPVARAATAVLDPEAEPQAQTRRGLTRGTVVIDVGSTKARIVAELEPMLAPLGGRFVGCHPLAGSEKRSIDAARDDLFDGSVTVLTPTETTNADALRQVERLWQAVGARTIRATPADHDALLAYTSHLPHVTAAALVLTAAAGTDPEDPTAVGRLADVVAGGFRDTTRVAAGDPALWRDILLDNRDCVATAIDTLSGQLTALREAIAEGNAAAIATLLTKAKETRDALTHRDMARR